MYSVFPVYIEIVYSHPKNVKLCNYPEYACFQKHVSTVMTEAWWLLKMATGHYLSF